MRIQSKRHNPGVEDAWAEDTEVYSADWKSSMNEYWKFEKGEGLLRVAVPHKVSQETDWIFGYLYERGEHWKRS